MTTHYETLVAQAMLLLDEANKDQVSLIARLDEAHKMVDQLILETPTGELRNALTDINLVLLAREAEKSRP